MTEEQLAEFYAWSGYRVLHSESGFWYSASPSIYHNLPLSEARDPTRAELKELFRRHRLFGVQFPSHSTGLATARYILRDKHYGLQSLQRQFRQHVRTGMKHCEIREIDFEQLHASGMRVNRDAMSRRVYHPPQFVDPSRWKQFCDAGSRAAGIRVLSATVDGELASYLVFAVVGETAYGLFMLSRADLRPFRPNHLLYHVFARDQIARPEVKAVSVGLQSVPAPRDIDHFKRHAGFTAEPCYVCAVLSPFARAVIQNPASRWALRVLADKVPGNPHVQRQRLVAIMADMTECRPD